MGLLVPLVSGEENVESAPQGAQEKLKNLAGSRENKSFCVTPRLSHSSSQRSVCDILTIDEPD